MHQNRTKTAKKAGIITVLLAGVLVIIKTIAFILSGSLAVLSSLVDSVMDIVVSVTNYAAICYSARPADDDHRYGHGKIEGLAAIGQAALMSGISVFLLMEAAYRALQERPVDASLAVLLIMGASLIISMVIIFLQNAAIKKSDSLAIESDKAHYSADVFQNLAVIIVIGLQYIGAPVWLDLLFAAGIALWMLYSAWGIAAKGVDMVLDREIAQEKREQLIALINAHEGVLGMHDLRATRHGMKEIISFDIEADKDLTLHVAHAITKDLETEILTIFPAAEIMIHVDPYGEIEDSRHTVAEVHHDSK